MAGRAVASWGAIFKAPGAGAATKAGQRKRKATGPASAGALTQYSLDFGQTINFGVRKCKTCGMEYTLGQPDDEAAHKKFHERVVSGAPMPECKSETVVR